ncbi:MAG: DUF465 domain-containing protein [Deltaproteobacteria bacterium]|jgi:uncharacterized protein YdcH (DUF465 family)|nr:DUF465 domain-containing protein [Deltaproteobacteria bacterium]
MEPQDEILIQKLLPTNPELKKLVTNHNEFEKRLEELNSLPFLTPTEDHEKKSIQKAKLAGKDKIMLILAPHRP